MGGLPDARVERGASPGRAPRRRAVGARARARAAAAEVVLHRRRGAARADGLGRWRWGAPDPRRERASGQTDHAVCLDGELLETEGGAEWVAAESQDAMAPSPSSLPSTSATVPAQSDARSGGSVIPSPIAIVAPSRAAADKSIPSPFLPSNATAMENKERKLFFFSLDLLRESLRGGYEKGICTRPVLTCFERVWEEDRKRKFVRDQSSRPEAGANPPQRGVTRCWFAPSCHALPTG